MKNINDINFYYDDNEKGKIKSAPIVYGLFALVLCLVIFNSFYALQTDINELKNTNKSLFDKTNQIEADIALYEAAMEEEISESEDDTINNFQDEFESFAKYAKAEYSPLDDKALGAIKNACVSGSFYANYEINETYFIIKGYAQNSNQVANIAYNLRSSNYLKDITINYITLAAEMETTKSLNYDLYEFEITGSIVGGGANE